MRSKELIGKLIGLARATEGNEHLLSDSIFSLIKVSLSGDGKDEELIKLCDDEKRKLVPDCFSCMCPCGRTSDYDLNELASKSGEGRDLRVLILTSLFDQKDFDNTLILRALYSVGASYWTRDELVPILKELTKGIIISSSYNESEIKRLKDLLDKEGFIVD